jgi:5'-3' exonuclease
MSLPRIYLIDASIYIFRAWHTYDTTITDRDGKPCNAVFGFSDFLYQLIHQKKPQFIACAFDSTQTNSYRRELYPAYKANREPAPEELKYQFAMCRSFCKAVGIPEFGSDRYEADDIIGSLAHHFRQQGFAITVVSADKDLAQLITGEEDQWWDFARSNLLDAHGVKQHFGVRPQQIADMLALSGDKVDNIPGIPGVGYTTAAKLLQRYECVEHILENIEKIAEMKFRGATRVQALLAKHHHILPLNKLLTTVVTNMDFDAPPDLNWRGVDNAAFALITEHLALSRALHQRWFSLAD